MESKDIRRSCADCGIINCSTMDKRFPDFCVSEALDYEWKNEVMELYNDEVNHRISEVSAGIESDFYCQKTRVEETIIFAKRMGAKKIGIATCVGLLKESRILAGLLRKNGFEVFGVGCKAGTVRKVDIGIPEKCENTGINMCNPILQAKLLNKEKTDLNIVMGLCVGHDSLFYKYSEAITTTLVVKDRVLVHNPVAALYAAEGYYSGKLNEIQDK